VTSLPGLYIVNDQKKLRKRILKERGIEDCGDGWYVDKKNRIWHSGTPRGDLLF
jgi:hypothetical protein